MMSDDPDLSQTGVITAMGFANVLTAKDVTLSVRDMVSFFVGAWECLWKCVGNWSEAYRSLQHGHI
jgi:hypothetical protein